MTTIDPKRVWVSCALTLAEAEAYRRAAGQMIDQGDIRDYAPDEADLAISAHAKLRDAITAARKRATTKARRK